MRTAAWASATAPAVLVGASRVAAVRSGAGLAVDESRNAPPNRSAIAVRPAAAAPNINLLRLTCSPSAGAEGPAGWPGPSTVLWNHVELLGHLVALVRRRDIRERVGERHVVRVHAVAQQVVGAQVRQAERPVEECAVALREDAEIDV